MYGSQEAVGCGGKAVVEAVPAYHSTIIFGPSGNNVVAKWQEKIVLKVKDNTA